MAKEIIKTENAPAPIGPYNQAVKTNGMLFISGQVGLKPGSSDFTGETITAQAHQVMQNLKAILQAAGMGFGNVVKTSIFLSDMSLFAPVNEVYAGYFEGNFPARETVAVKGLPKNADVEISMIAAE